MFNRADRNPVPDGAWRLFPIVWQCVASAGTKIVFGTPPDAPKFERDDHPDVAPMDGMYHDQAIAYGQAMGLPVAFPEEQERLYVDTWTWGKDGWGMGFPIDWSDLHLMVAYIFAIGQWKRPDLTRVFFTLRTDSCDEKCASILRQHFCPVDRVDASLTLTNTGLYCIDIEAVDKPRASTKAS